VHFRSLDTWLEGKCESCCPEHAWTCNETILATAAGKRSIFNDDDDDDESAGCPDDVDGDDDELEKSLDKSLSFDIQGVMCESCDIVEGGEGKGTRARTGM